MVLAPLHGTNPGYPYAFISAENDMFSVLVRLWIILPNQKQLLFDVIFCGLVTQLLLNLAIAKHDDPQLQLPTIVVKNSVDEILASWFLTISTIVNKNLIVWQSCNQKIGKSVSDLLQNGISFSNFINQMSSSFIRRVSILKSLFSAENDCDKVSFVFSQIAMPDIAQLVGIGLLLLFSSQKKKGM
jgi:hypothetical protein